MNATLGGFIRYFLYLGALGFGGPVALTEAMRRDLVEEKKWIEPAVFEDGLALAAACPGPLAYQLAVYLGYVRHRIAGAIAVAIAFALPPFLVVLICAAIYRRYSGAWQLQALFYGIGPAVVALIIKACWKLTRNVLRVDRLAWALAIVACAITVVLQRELALLFIAAGLIGIILFGVVMRKRALPALSILPATLLTGTTMKLFLFFFKTGLLVFGSGLVIVPFLKTQLVDQYHWLTDRQFLDSVAIGMISPGPVVITATFVGYLLQGLRGAVAATAGIFLPPFLFVVLATPLLLRYRNNPYIGGFVRGVGSAVVGVLAGTTWMIAQKAIVDLPTAIAAAVAVLLITVWKRIPDPAVIAAAGIFGLLVYRL